MTCIKSELQKNFFCPRLDVRMIDLSLNELKVITKK